MSIIVVGGVIEKNGKFLLVQEANDKIRGKWNLPAGNLDNNETVFEGAKREIFEECGCKVELTGVLQVANSKMKDNRFISVIFKTELVDDNIKFNKDEILDVKWFTYEEILKMKDSLRRYDWITDAISAHVNNRVADINIIKVID